MNKRLHDDIISQLNDSIKGYSFINVISFILLEDFALDKSCYDRLSESELFFIIGLWLKNIEYEDVVVNEKDVYDTVNHIRELLRQLHLTFLPSIKEMKKYVSCDGKINIMHDEHMIQETIFYGDGGAYDLQYINFVKDKYENDRDWILENKRIDIYDFENFFDELRKELIRKINEYYRDVVRTKYNTNYSVNYPYTYKIKYFTDINPSYLDIIKCFSIDIKNPIDININNFGDFNPIVKTPIIKINDDEIYVPYIQLVARAFYEVPFYWICSDKKYYENIGVHNRGNAGESITSKLLMRVFPKGQIFNNVIVKHNKDVKAEIDVLVLNGNVAFVFQVKSKRLSLNSYKGDKESIASDYEKAIGKAYSQACLSEKEMKNPDNIVLTSTGESLNMQSVNEVIKIGVTLDFFPAVESITRRSLDESAEFISLSIFDLDMICRYADGVENFKKYFRQRTKRRTLFYAPNEATYLGYYLKHKEFLNPKNYDFVGLSNEYGDIIDSIMYRDLIQERYPDVIKEERTKNDYVRNIRRNDKCPCGSGKKYKKCCGK
ncbi:MAG: NERD domain-containing protein [Bacteroidales bacterium]|nr:NERD domain-containing protein [Bacteroidales bacterium]